MKTTVTSFKKSTQPELESLPARVLQALRKVLPDPAKTYPLHEPEFSGNEWKYVKECIDSRMVSSVGSYVDRFERMLEEYTGAKHAVAVVNGTAGLHIALKLAGVQPGDEMLVPALTFVASANAVSYCGATPHFVDSEEGTLGMNPDKLAEYLRNQTEQRSGVCIHRRTGKVIRAMLPMHTFGHPVRLEELMRVARDFHITLIEDAAESIGSLYYGKHTGTFGVMGVLSFNGNKTITTGGGGAILTNDTDLAKHAKHLTTTAKLPHPWDYRHDEIGYNYRLPNLNAALGCAQLEQLPGLLAAKMRLYELYQNALKWITDVNLSSSPPGCRSNYWLQTLVLKKEREGDLESVLAKLHQEKILARPAWNLLHQLDPYRTCPRMPLEAAEVFVRRILNLPSTPGLASGAEG